MIQLYWSCGCVRWAPAAPAVPPRLCPACGYVGPVLAAQETLTLSQTTQAEPDGQGDEPAPA